MAIPWGRGVGKSYFMRLACYLLIAEWEYRQRPGADTHGVRIVILMPTLVQFKKVHLSAMLGELCGKWSFLGAVVNKTLMTVTFPGGSWIQVVSAEEAEGNRGIRCDLVVIDEADDVDPDLVKAITLAYFTEPHALRLMLIGGTPKRGRYGLLWMAHSEWPASSARCFSVHATCYDTSRVDPTYIDETVKPKISTAMFRREYLCDFDSAEGLVYGHFDPEVHVREPDEGTRFSEILVGADFGFEDPGVFLVIGVTGSGRDAQCWILEEVYEQHQHESWWVLQAQRIEMVYGQRYPSAKRKWYHDPSAASRCSALKADAHCNLQEVDNSIEDGVNYVADALVVRELENRKQWTQLYVSPTCENTIIEFGRYKRKRDPKNTERVLDDILDRDNHAMDSLRYALYNRFGGIDRRIGGGYGHT